MATPQPPVKRTNPALAVMIIACLSLVMAAVFYVTKDDGSSSGGVPLPADSGASAPKPAGVTPAVAAAAAPSVPDGPIVAPGYKMTAIYVPPQGSNDTSKLDKRLYDSIVAGVNWNDSAKLYGRRYPLQYIFQNATTNLLLKPADPEQAKKLLAATGMQKPKFLLTFNATDNVFATWLTQQVNALGFNVVTDANSFTPDEKAKGYHGMIIAILPA